MIVFDVKKTLEKGHFVFGKVTFRFIFREHFVLRIIQEIKTATPTTETLNANSPVYDIAGRKVATYGELSNGYIQLPKGLYIMNGKKVIIR